MDYTILIHPFFVLLLTPLLSSFLLMSLHKAHEIYIKRCVRLMNLWAVAASLFAVTYSATHGFPFQASFHIALPILEEPIWFAFTYDRVSLVFSLLTTFFGWVVIHFSSVYMHREYGYLRFFIFVFFLIFGMQCMAVADNLTAFFCGWEIIGLASFFLISFYRTLENPVKNALKVFTVYRLGDLGFLCGLLFSHKLLNNSHGHDVFFSSLSSILAQVDAKASMSIVIVALGVLCAAAAKSGQFPFCYWVPRAMEGPTPSSAIFYGALSIHAGVLLLIRMMPAWYGIPFVRWCMAGLALITFFYGIVLEKTQSSIKAKLAYGSVIQVSVMFLELSLGWLEVALVHVTLHALYRAYLILVSPSVVIHAWQAKVHGHATTQMRFKEQGRSKLRQRIESTLYVMALQDGYVLHGIDLWVMPVLTWLQKHVWVWGFGLVCGSSGLTWCLGESWEYLCVLWAVMGTLVCSCYSLHGVDPKKIFDWVLVSVASAHAAAYVWAPYALKHHLPMVFLGWIISWVLARVSIMYLSAFAADRGMALGGMFAVRPFWMWFLTLNACAFMGVPPFLSFFAEETLMLPMVDHSWLAPLTLGLAFALNGMALFRGIARVGMGMPSTEEAQPQWTYARVKSSV